MAAQMDVSAVGFVDVCGVAPLVDVSLPVFIWNISANFLIASVCHPWRALSPRMFLIVLISVVATRYASSIGDYWGVSQYIG